jgi:hypothetical protein
MTQLEFDPAATGPASFPVVVIIKRRPSANRWINYTWQISGVVVNSREQTAAMAGVRIRSAEDGDEFLWGGLSVTLYKDQCESYYHNLLAAQPNLYVITRDNERGEPVPFRVSASFDEANAYTEAEEQAYPVPMPAELYGWIERYVLTHYVPEPRKKRKRRNWKDGE